MIGTPQFKEGLIFKNENGELVEILEYQHHRKSQARAVVRVKLKNLRIIHVKFNVVCDCFEENHGYLAFFSCKIGKRRLLLVINGLKNSKKTVNL